MPAESSLLLKKDNISIRVLELHHREEALKVLAEAFCTEPACADIAEFHPNLAASFSDWLEFVGYLIDYGCTNGISVVAIDDDANRIAAVYIVRDNMFVPCGFEEKYNSDEKSLTPWMNFQWYADKQALGLMPELAEPGKTADLWFLGVHPDYRGKKLSNELINCLLPLVKRAGFKYASIQATNAFTSKAAAWNKFEKIYSIHTKDWLWKGEPIFEHTKEPHVEWSVWVKLLND
ncbi:uncharacterized protein LOC105850130 isoform X2 [Hydra vulgaris]|uniref:Uncharacterized protein LOC105850130 isoform X2 n=1 Tax=Hydra vulgaris TaxID=6087 RepID=A0ABM4C9A2_HYDVU